MEPKHPVSPDEDLDVTAEALPEDAEEMDDDWEDDDDVIDAEPASS